MATEQTYSQSMSAEQVKAIVEARVKAAIDEGSKRVTPQIAQPQNWWNIWAMGPFQVTGPGSPLLPHKVIRIGETFYVATVIWLNPTLVLPGGMTPCQVISGLGCICDLDYCTIDMCNLKSVTAFSPKDIKVQLVSGTCYYVNVQQFTAVSGTESCIYEMNICAGILGCQNLPTALAGFVTEVYDFDADVFYPPAPPLPPPVPPMPMPVPPTPYPGTAAGWRFNQPIRFQIYP
jgi:hypothetical protein